MIECFKIANADIVHESFGGDLVVLNLGSGQYFGLNTSGAALWTAIVNGHKTTEIVQGEAAVTFAAQLVELGLIVANDEQASQVLVTPIVLAEAPVIEVYDDLADLIVADPIHDVDAEVGWPKLPEAL
jgi:hypothetical protein